jgi:hypothetical protein
MSAHVYAPDKMTWNEVETEKTNDTTEKFTLRRGCVYISQQRTIHTGIHTSGGAVAPTHISYSIKQGNNRNIKILQLENHRNYMNATLRESLAKYEFSVI